MARKLFKELMHYVILALLMAGFSTGATAIAVQIKFFSWVLLHPFIGYPLMFFWYFAFLLLPLLFVDMLLHKLFKL